MSPEIQSSSHEQRLAKSFFDFIKAEDPTKGVVDVALEKIHHPYLAKLYLLGRENDYEERYPSQISEVPFIFEVWNEIGKVAAKSARAGMPIDPLETLNRKMTVWDEAYRDIQEDRGLIPVAS